METAVKVLTLKEKLTGLIRSLLEDSALPKMYLPVIKTLVDGYLKTTDESEIRKLLTELKDKILPWLLS